MNIWFTADLHLGHENIIKYSRRPFSNVKVMNDVLIQNWNSLVKKDDKVYVVGDFTLAGRVEAIDYLAELNGYVYVMPGSHDRWIEENKKTGYVPYTKQHPVSLLPPLYSFEPNGISTVVLCHYAMRSWHLSHYGSWHLFGHHHGNLEPYGLSFDIGVDTHNFFPWHIDEVAEKMKTLKPIVDYSKR